MDTRGFRALRTCILLTAMLAGCANGPHESSRGVSIRDMSVQDSVISRDIDAYGGILSPKNVGDTMPNEGKVYCFVTLRWANASQRGGIQNLRWDWYTGDALNSTYYGIPPLDFGTSPDTFVGYRAARLLGVGKHKVRLYIQDPSSGEYVLVVEKDFTITDTDK